MLMESSEEPVLNLDIDETHEKQRNEKKRARLEALKSRKKNKKTSSLQPQLRHLSPADQARTFWELYLETAGQNLSQLEREESLQEQDFIAFNSFPERSLKTLPEALIQLEPHYEKHYLRARTQPQRKMAGPRLLILTLSAIRAVDLVRSARVFANDRYRVAKLFAKHLKVEEQMKMLSKEDVRIGVGVPARVKTLVEKGGLKLGNLKYVVLDLEQDAKQFDLMSLKQVRHEFFVLFREYLLPLMKSKGGKVQLVCF